MLKSRTGALPPGADIYYVFLEPAPEELGQGAATFHRAVRAQVIQLACRGSLSPHVSDYEWVNCCEWESALSQHFT